MDTEPTAALPTSMSVIVCAYTEERWEDLERAIGSLRVQTHPVAQIVLVIDNNDVLLERSVAGFPGVLVIPNARTRGLSGARNTGVAAAVGEIVAFLDDDAAADPDWADRLLGAYRSPAVIGAGGTVVPRWLAPRPDWLPEEFLWTIGCSYRGLPVGRAEIRNANGANMSFRRSVFATAGDFDPSVGRIGKDAGGCEETEFSIRALRTHPGGRIVLEPDAVCHHTVTAQRTTKAYFTKRCSAEGRSKAVVSQLSGATAALSLERVYVRRVLPAGVLRGLGELARGDRGGGARAWSIVEGLAVTSVSYARMRVSIARSTRGPAAAAAAGQPVAPPR